MQCRSQCAAAMAAASAIKTSDAALRTPQSPDYKARTRTRTLYRLNPDDSLSCSDARRNGQGKQTETTTGLCLERMSSQLSRSPGPEYPYASQSLHCCN